MTEVDVGNTEQPKDSNVAQQPSAGMLLRQAREAKSMSVQTLASALKVPAYKLQALEEDQWDQLTDSVFTRSLALSVCRVLRIPPEPVLAGLPKLQGAKLAANPEGINAPFKEKSLRSMMSSSQEPASGKAVKAAVALLIAIAGGAGLYFLPHWQAGSDGDSDAGQVAESVAAEPLFLPQQADSQTVVTIIPALTDAAAPVSAQTVEVVGEAAGDAASIAKNAAAPATAAVETAAALIEPVLKDVQTTADTTGVAPAPTAVEPVLAASGATNVDQPKAAPSAPVASDAASDAVLRFTASAESWVQVRDAQRRVVMEKILKAGDVYEATAAGRPFQVVVGNAGATALEVDGAAFDLAASAKNNVARFEVK